MEGTTHVLLLGAAVLDNLPLSFAATAEDRLTSSATPLVVASALGGEAGVILVPVVFSLCVRCVPMSGLEPGLTVTGDLASGPRAALGQPHHESLCGRGLHLQHIQARHHHARDVFVAAHRLAR